jgi:hypothetical protein
MDPVASSKVLGFKTFDNHCPTKTPTKLVLINAKADPQKTTQGLWDWALMSNVATWVLSPNSAKKIVTKVEAKQLQMAEKLAFSGSRGSVSTERGSTGDDMGDGMGLAIAQANHFIFLSLCRRDGFKRNS